MVYWEVAEGPPRALAPSSTARSLSSEAKSDGMTDPDWERIASRFGMPEGTAVALGLAPNPQAAPGADDSAARKLQDIVQRAKHALVSYDTLPPEDEHIAFAGSSKLFESSISFLFISLHFLQALIV